MNRGWRERGKGTMEMVITVGFGIYTVPLVFVPSGASSPRSLNSVISKPANLFSPILH